MTDTTSAWERSDLERIRMEREQVLRSGGVDAGTANTGAMRTQIEETRQRMSSTLDQIGERLNPHHLKEQIKDNIRDATVGRVEDMARSASNRVKETRQSITNTIRENPIPASLIGIGLGWLVWNGRQGTSSEGARSTYRETPLDGYQGSNQGGRSWNDAEAPLGEVQQESGTMDRARKRVGEIADDVRAKTDDLAGQAQEAAGRVAHRVQDAAGNVAETTRFQARRLEDHFYENPLAVAAATLALGVAAGLAIPVTRKEAEIMGGARDQLVAKVREAADATSEKVQHVADRVIEQAQSTAKDAAREEGLTS